MAVELTQVALGSSNQRFSTSLSRTCYPLYAAAPQIALGAAQAFVPTAWGPLMALAGVPEQYNIIDGFVVSAIGTGVEDFIIDFAPANDHTLVFSCPMTVLGAGNYVMFFQLNPKWAITKDIGIDWRATKGSSGKTGTVAAKVVFYSGQGLAQFLQKV